MKWFNNSNHLVCTSWDKLISLYNISIDSKEEDKSNSLVHRYYSEAGVLDCCISSDDNKIFNGGCDNKLYSFDVKTLSSPSIIGSHTLPIRHQRKIQQHKQTTQLSHLHIIQV